MRKQLVRVTAALLVVVMTSGCAYFLRPEQRGNTSGPIDGWMLAGDILWFIPGIIPGVVALSVDFASGAIRRSGHGWVHRRVPVAHGQERVLPRGTRVVITPPVVDRAGWFEVRLVSERGALLARAGDLVLPGQAAGRLTLRLPAVANARAPGGVKAELQLVVDGKLGGRVPVRLE